MCTAPPTARRAAAPHPPPARPPPGQLADTAGTLGWRGEAAQAAEARQVRHGSQLDQTAEALTRAASALGELEGLLRAGSRRLVDLRERREDLVRLLVVQRLVPVLVQVAARVGTRVEDEIREVDAAITAEVDRLAEADLLLRERLERVVVELGRLGRWAAQDQWLFTAAPLEVLAVLGRYGVVEDRADHLLLAWAEGLPADESGAALLRGRLGALSPEQVADLLLRHPGLAQRLTGALPTNLVPGSPEAVLAAAQAAAYSDPAARVAGVAAAFARLSAEQRRMLALLYPAVVGRLDGAPLADRIAANRVQIAAALQSERERTRDGDEQRIAYYQRLLYEEVRSPALAADRPRVVGHQVLYFDPWADGAIAEMWGPVDAQTRNLAVFVPGTGTDLGDYEKISYKMYLLAKQDTSGATTTIAWLGRELPDTIPQAALSGYAETGGRALRDFVTGLEVPAAVDVTAVGYSYGGAVVGVSEREGLQVDRVLHIESAGAGSGVTSVGDYANHDVARYTMLAPGDLIAYSQGVQLGPLGHGGDVNDMEGFTRLETGRYGPAHERAGQMIEGGDAHSGVLTPGSTSWDNMSGVVRGGQVVPYSPPVEHVHPGVVGPLIVPVPVTHLPYEDPAYPGLPPIDVP